MNRKTLQYYDEIGLFSPAYVAENGYRYYSLFQLDWLALIAVLRDLGVPLREIRQYQECGSTEKLEYLLEAQSKKIDHYMELLRRRKAMLTDVREENRAFCRYGGKGFQILTWEEAPVLAADPGEARTAFCSQLSDRRPQNRAFCGKKSSKYSIKGGLTGSFMRRQANIFAGMSCRQLPFRSG